MVKSDAAVVGVSSVIAISDLHLFDASETELS
jgi:hypothetical protein